MRLSLVLLVCLGFFALVSVILWVRTETVRKTYQYVQQEKELLVLQDQIQSLRAKYLRATNPKRLEGMAHVLGLVPPKLHQVLQYAPQSELD